MCISGGVWEPTLGYSWAWIFGLYHPCILLSGVTHAWSIRIFAVCIFEYIIEFWALLKRYPVKRYEVPHPYPLPSLWRSSHQEPSWADSQPYGIPISVEFL